MTVETPARPAAPDELVTTSVGATGRTSTRKRPAAQLAERAAALDWTVHGPWLARGPVTQGRRQDEPNADGVRPIIATTTVEDTFAVRLEDASGRRLTALWSPGGVECRAWTVCDHPLGRCPRLEDERVACNMRALSLAELKTIVEQGPRTEGEEAMRERGKDVHYSQIETWAVEAIADGALMDNISDPIDGYMSGYRDGYARSSEEHGDAYGEGYAAGLAAVAGRAQVWVKTRKRLDALRPGDVILGKGDRWWIVSDSNGRGAGKWEVVASDAQEYKSIVADGQRKVDVVEQIALADALAALKNEDMGAEPLQADSVESEVA